MKKARKVLIPLSLAMAAMTLAACGDNNGGGDPTKINISIYSFNGGVGNEWLDNAIKAFEESHADVSYEEGLTGVRIQWGGDTDSVTNLSKMKSSSQAIYFSEKGDTPYDLSNKGSAYDLTELVKGKADPSEEMTIEDKIDEGYRSVLQGEDGKYYALPHYEWYPGLTYDVSAFDSQLAYFAASDETDVRAYEAHASIKGNDIVFGTANLIGSATAKKSCGNDGLYGTDDDGLPSSIEEFLILCSYLDNNGIKPLAMCPGNHRDYSAYLSQGLLTSLLGQNIQDFYDFDGEINVLERDSSGNIVMDGTKEMFCAGSGIPAPKFKTVTVTEQTGYLTRETYERYYVASLVKVLLDCNFCTDKSTKSTDSSNLNTQYGFINKQNSYAAGMMVEGNYWYNESNTQGYFTNYKRKTGEDRNLGWMSLPSKLTGTVEEDTTGEGYKTPLLDTGYSYCIVNKAQMERQSEGYRRAVLDFVKFLYTEEQLEAFTKTTGVGKAAIKYNCNTDDVIADLSGFQKQVLNLKTNNGVVYSTAAAKTFRRHQADFQFGIRAPIWLSMGYTDYVTAFTDKSKANSVADVVSGSFITPERWDAFYYVA